MTEESNKCYSANEKDYHDDIGSVIDEILDNCSGIEEAMQLSISVGNSVRPAITGDDLAGEVSETIGNRLCDYCGEFADNFELTDAEYLELKTLLTTWIDKVNFNCYSVENIKQFPLTDFIETTEIVEYYK